MPLAIADNENVPWVVLTRASEIRLYSSEAGKGVGGKGRTETFVEINLSLIPERLAGYLMLLFSAQALAQGGSLDEILSDSSRYAADLAVRLRERVYRKTMPLLAQGRHRAHGVQLRRGSEERVRAGHHHPVSVAVCRLRRGPGPGCPTRPTDDTAITRLPELPVV